MRLSLPAGETASTGRVRIVRRGKAVGTQAITLTGGQTKTVKVKLARKSRTALASRPWPEGDREGDADRRPGNTGKVSKTLRIKR